MTVDNARVAIDIVAEDPGTRLYVYTHAQTHRVLYALFPHGQYDDMAWAPDVANPVLLYDHGRWTDQGACWLTVARKSTPGEDAL